MENPRSDLLPLSPAIGRLMALEQLAARRSKPKRQKDRADRVEVQSTEAHLVESRDRRASRVGAAPVSQDT